VVRYVGVRQAGGGGGGAATRQGGGHGITRYRSEGIVRDGRVEAGTQMSIVKPPPCRHCKNRLGYRPRGLCSLCYFTPGIREQYPIDRENGSDAANGRAYTSRVARRAARGLPAEPTDALPGTAEKVEVLRERAQQGVSLWHPLDSCMDPKSKELS
jgi:hypothetical protein